MKPFIEDICRYAATQDNFFTIGGNLFIGELPKNTNGVFAIAASGNEPDKDLPTFDQIIDFWALYPSEQVALETLMRLYDLFHQLTHYQTDSYYVQFSLAMSRPIDVDRNAEGRKLMRLGVRCNVFNLIS